MLMASADDDKRGGAQQHAKRWIAQGLPHASKKTAGAGWPDRIARKTAPQRAAYPTARSARRVSSPAPKARPIDA